MKVTFWTLAVVVAVALLILTPLFTIWTINTLFSTDIPYTFWTWLAAFWLTAVIANPKMTRRE